MMRIAYQGEPGAFGEEAALLDAGRNVVLLPMHTFDDVVSAVMGGAADQGVLPVANSIIGTVRPGAAAAATPGLAILRRVSLPVQQCLLAKPGAVLDRIDRVISHPAALSQCRTFLAQHRVTPVEWYDTAGAAKHVASADDSTLAAIASRRAAERYGLQILAEDIQDRQDNITEFVVVRCENGP